MLYNAGSGECLDHVPHAKDYEIWMARLSDQEKQAIFAELEKVVEQDQIHTSSWIPGDDWSNSPFHAIYAKACRGHQAQAGMCFGLMLWEFLLTHEATWAFGRYEKDGIPIRGMTYFRIDDRGC